MQCRDTKNVRRKQVSLQLKWMKKQDEEEAGMYDNDRSSSRYAGRLWGQYSNAT